MTRTVMGVPILAGGRGGIWNRGDTMGTRETSSPRRARAWMAALLSVAFVAGGLLLPAPAPATPGVVANVSLSLSPSSIRADGGTSTSTATATVTDSSGLPVALASVTFGTDGDVTFSPPTGVAT